MNLTLSVDERVVRRARKAADSLGISLNEAVRRYLQDLAGDHSADRDIQELEALSQQSKGRSHGRRFDRNEIHERP